MVEWNSLLYLKFKRERTLPSIDLAGRIEIENPGKILDIGCGPGNSTSVLRERFPGAAITGIDSSEDMIRQARESYSNIEFIRMDAHDDLASLGKFDVVFSNAAVQWIPDHPVLFRKIMAALRSGGQMAIQVPMNMQEPVQKSITKTVTSPEWCSHFPNPRIFFTLGQGEYYDLLDEIAHDFTLWQTTYFHIMDSHEAILEWYKGTGLRPYMAVLNDAERARFEQEILDQLRREYPVQKNGNIIFRFPRFFMTAVAR